MAKERVTRFIKKHRAAKSIKCRTIPLKFASIYSLLRGQGYIYVGINGAYINIDKIWGVGDKL